MKPTMMYTLIIIAAIILMSAFGLTLSPTVPLKVPENMLGNVLYVCPAADSIWDGIARGVIHMRKPLIIAFLFAIMLLMAVWGWALYQNLLKDKFNRDAFKNPWSYTKMLFWATVTIIILMYTPNHFRSVHLKNTGGEWVLCENNTPGARAVRANMVETR